MSDKDTYIKVPPGSKVEISSGVDDVNEAEDLARNSGGASYNQINSSEINQESNYKAPASSSSESSSSQQSSSSGSSFGNFTQAKVNETSSSGDMSSADLISDIEVSDEVKKLELRQENEKTTLKIKIKNYFKFK